MKTPRFSVVIPTLNEEKFIPTLLSSLVGQTVRNFDVTVVDGASVDGTVAAARRFMKILPRLKILTVDTPGVSRQRNLGARAGKGEWLVFVDADSALLPHFFERISWYIDQKKPKFFTTWFKADSDEPAEAIAGFLGNIGVEAAILIERPWAPGPLTVVRRDVFERVGGYDEGATFAEDHDLAMEIYEKGVPFQVFREILYIYSMRRFRREGTLRVLERNLLSALRVIRKRRGPKHMPGFVAGGLLYKEKHIKSPKKTSGLADLENSVRKFISEFISL